MKLAVISLFPEMFDAITDYGVVGRALKASDLELTLVNPRQFTDDKHSTVDGRPYGGGPGMVMLAEPLARAIKAAKRATSESTKVVYLSPQGQRFTHSAAREFSQLDSLILVAGRYEGVDERVLNTLVDEEWSIGDYVLSGGELAAMVIVDALVRLRPNSLGNAVSAEQDSFEDGLLDCPHYTRPERYLDQSVPEVLLSGDHQAIEKWRREQQLGRTWQRRPDLLEKIDLTEADKQLLEKYKKQFT